MTSPIRSSQFFSATAFAAAGSELLFRVLQLLRMVLGALPLPVRVLLGRALGRLFALVPTVDREIAREQLRLALGTAAPLGATYAHMGQVLIESLNHRPFFSRYGAEIIFPDAAVVADVIARGRGMLALSGHLGNWELLAAYMAHLGYSVKATGRRANNPAVHRLLVSLREESHVDTLWRDTLSGPRDIVQLFRERRVVASLIDQDVDLPGAFVPFFGRLANTPTGIIELARRKEVPICALFCVRTGLYRYCIRAVELDSSVSSEATAAEYHVHLERLIRLYPDQWIWFHKRWRRTPDGASPRTREYLELLRRTSA